MAYSTNFTVTIKTDRRPNAEELKDMHQSINDGVNREWSRMIDEASTILLDDFSVTIAR